MARELALGVEVVGVPTVREDDGMALSSRNRYLSPEQRATAATISRALRAGADAGPRGADAVLAAAAPSWPRRPTCCGLPGADRPRPRAPPAAGPARCSSPPAPAAPDSSTTPTIDLGDPR
jgi:pantoate--beta-alanine ligase